MCQATKHGEMLNGTEKLLTNHISEKNILAMERNVISEAFCFSNVYSRENAINKPIRHLNDCSSDGFFNQAHLFFKPQHTYNFYRATMRDSTKFCLERHLYYFYFSRNFGWKKPS